MSNEKAWPGWIYIYMNTFLCEKGKLLGNLNEAKGRLIGVMVSSRHAYNKIQSSRSLIWVFIAYSNAFSGSF